MIGQKFENNVNWIGFFEIFFTFFWEVAIMAAPLL